MAAIPQDILDRLRRLESEMREVRGRAQIRPAMDQILSGSVVVGEGGSLSVLDPSRGHTTFHIGEIFPEIKEFGTVIRRDDGSVAISVSRGPLADPAQSQTVRIKDAAGNEIFSGESVSGEGGIARPYIPLPIPMEESTSKWPSTTSATFATVGRSNGIIQQPKARVYAQVTASGGATGQVRFLVNGSTVATGTAGQPLVATFSIPSYTYGMVAEFELQARVASGTGTAYAMTRYLYGWQS
ncbi:hypothetical protein SEA_PICARD_20 [Streptomyces phage Picard]|uniref:Uncharacterized protein n=1 Tax=Streptomyces phage Picard TaxID=1920311 RepID=A0A1J0MC40_9CAUD|nr:hypothetical protein HOR45_gp20 [Streptomyces phage Picard]APD18587.1 hypothetical protein SEA_PICARD_20 [Streptomyces phage Picard]